MSTPRHGDVSFTFQFIFDAASKEYNKKTGQDLQMHSLAAELDHCNSPDAILKIFQKQADALDQAAKHNQTLIKWLNPTVHLLYMLSATIAEGVGLTFSPANVIFTGIGVLLRVAKDVAESHGVLIEIFERIQSFLTRLDIYLGIALTAEMITMLGKIMAEVLTILALSTNEMQERRIKRYTKRLVGRTGVKDALQRLDKLTQEEAQMTVTKNLQVTHSIQKFSGMFERILSRELLRSWLSPPNPSINHNIARGSHHDTTGTWFVHGNLFAEWKSSGSLLWVHGKPGSGKSILASVMIEDVKAICNAGMATFAYFYFDFKDSSKRDIRSLLSSILVQLSDQSNQSRSILSDLYASHRDGSDQPSEAALTKCLRDILNQERRLTTFIIVDALDECPNTPGIPSAREKVLNLVEDLVKSHTDLRICVTSRPEPDIRVVLEPLTPRHISLHVQDGQRDDIVDYVRFIVHSDRTMRKWKPEDKELVIDTLVERADGMFRWAFCQLETLRRCFPPSIRRVLDELPTTLDGTYERMLLEIPEEKWKHAHRLLQCLALSSRPLRVEELGEVLSIQFDSTTMPKLITGWRPENTEDTVLSACSSLIAIVKVEDFLVVQFSHFSVKEFLISDRLATAQTKNLSRYHIALEPAHRILAQACLSTLLELDEHTDKQKLKNYPLAFYAAEHWPEHARFGDVSLSVQDMMRQLFDPGKPHFSTWIWIYDVDDPLPSRSIKGLAEHRSQPLGTPLSYSARYGLYVLTEQLLSVHPNDVDLWTLGAPGPLWQAIRGGYLDVARLLLEHGADVNHTSTSGWTTLHVATLHSDNNAIQLLLEHGADVNGCNEKEGSPLQLASGFGDINSMQLLLRHGANVNYYDSETGSSPLIEAVQSGSIEAVRLLIQHKPDLDHEDNQGWTALLWASPYEDTEIAQALLEYDAEAHGRNISESMRMLYELSKLRCRPQDLSRRLAVFSLERSRRRM